MFNIKTMACFLAVTLAILFVTAPNLEAGHRHHHCRRSSVNINIGPVVPTPTYVISPAYTPVYVAPQPVVAYPVYQTVYEPVYIAPQPSFFSGFSFGWFFH